MASSRTDYTFDFAISFAGEDRHIAEQIADALTRGGARVFYYEYFGSELLGKSGTRAYNIIYGRSTRFFVPLILKYYVNKDIPDYEWQIARDEATRRNYEFILPIRLDDSKLIGLHGDIIFATFAKILWTLLCKTCWVSYIPHWIVIPNG